MAFLSAGPAQRVSLKRGIRGRSRQKREGAVSRALSYARRATTLRAVGAVGDDGAARPGDRGPVTTHTRFEAIAGIADASALNLAAVRGLKSGAETGVIRVER